MLFKDIPQERVSEGIREQILPLPRTQELVVEVFNVKQQEWVSESWRWGTSFFQSGGSVEHSRVLIVQGWTGALFRCLLLVTDVKNATGPWLS